MGEDSRGVVPASRERRDTLVIRVCLTIVIIGLVVSGVTAFRCAKN